MDVYFIAPDAGGVSILVIYEFFSGGSYVDYNFYVAVPTAGQTFESLRQDALSNMNAYATLHSYSVSNIQRYYPNPATSSVEGIMSASDKAKLDGLATVASTGDYNDLLNTPTIPDTTRATSTLSASLVGTGATGSQISSTKDSSIKVTVSTSTTATIGAAATSLVILKTCATNSATEGDWIEQGRAESGQTVTLAVALQSVQTIKNQICADIPAGYYYKLVNSGTGTHSESVVSGQKTIFG